MRQIILATMVTSSLYVTSCGDKEKVNDAVTEATTSAVAVKGITPVEAVERWKANLLDGKIVSLWEALPASYQKDVTSLAQSFGAKVDAEIYNESMSIVASLSQLLKSKKGMVLEMIDSVVPDGESGQASAKNISENYDSIVSLINAIANSDVKSADSMKTVDIPKLMGELQPYIQKLAALGSMAGEQYETLKNLKVDLVSESDDQAVVNLTGDGKTEESKITKVDDVWVPSDMASEWGKMIKDTSQSIDSMSQMKPEQKQQAMLMLGMAKATISKLEKSKSKEDFMQTIQGLFPFLQGM